MIKGGFLFFGLSILLLAMSPALFATDHRPPLGEDFDFYASGDDSILYYCGCNASALRARIVNHSNVDTINWAVRNPSGTAVESGSLAPHDYEWSDWHTCDPTGWWRVHITFTPTEPQNWVTVRAVMNHPELEVAPEDEIRFSMIVGGSNPSFQLLSLWSSNINGIDLGSWTITKSGSMASRITVNPTSGSGESDVHITVDGSGLDAGVYLLGTLTVEAVCAIDSPQNVDVYLHVNPTLNVHSSPIKGVNISGSPSGTTDYSTTLTYDYSVNLVAPLTHPEGDTDYEFVRWFKNLVDQGGSNTLNFNITEDTICEAQYQKIKRTLNVQSTPVTGVPFMFCPSVKWDSEGW